MADATQVLQSQTGGAEEAVQVQRRRHTSQVVDIPVMAQKWHRRKLLKCSKSERVESVATMFISAPVVEVPPVVGVCSARSSCGVWGARTRGHSICGNHVIRGSVFLFQPLHSEIGAPLHVERVIAPGGLDVHFEIHVTVESDFGDTSCYVGVTEFSGVVQFVWKLENTVPPVIALSFHFSATEDVDHEAFWRL